MKRLILMLLLCMMTVTFSACGETQQQAATEKQTEVGYYLDTIITLTAYVEDASVLKDAMAECGRMDALLSRTAEGSDVWKINHAEGSPVTVSDETVTVLQEAVRISRLSEGAFDVTIAPASTLWDSRTGTDIVPDADALAAAAERVDYTRVQIDGNTVTMPAGMMVDLGGIAKGYIADRVKEYLVSRGVESAILAFGGNIVAIGLKPGGKPWKVGIQDIDEAAGVSMLVSLNYGGSTVTSGIYERGFEKDGVYYHHILSTETGWPVQNELASVTIFSDSSMTGDALSTAAFAMGLEKGKAFIESIDGVEAVFIERDRTVTTTSGAGHYLSE